MQFQNHATESHIPAPETAPEAGSPTGCRLKKSEFDMFANYRSKTDTKFPKDEWRHENNCWIRVHNKPRRALFAPTGTKDGPPIESLEPGRITQIKFVKEVKEKTHRDSWCDSSCRGRPC